MTMFNSRRMQGVICLPLELMLDIAARCDTEDILALTQTCVQFRNQCAAIYLNRLGIYSKDQHGIQICLALGPFSAWSVSMLLCLETYTGSRISLAVDYYHIVALLPNIQSLLKKIPISDFELRLSEDEHDLLRIRRLFPAIPSVLAHLPRQCSRVSFTTISPEERRPCLKHYDDIASAFKPPKKFHSKPLASVTQLNLSTPFLDHGALRDPIGTLLHQPGIHMLSINCETTNDSDYVLKRANLRNLELLTVRLSNNSMATLPTSFPKHHTKLRSICLLTCCPWDSQSFERSKTCVSLPSLRYATLSSKYLKFHVQDASSLRDLKISSFMAFPIPQNRGYCTVFQSLLSIWVHSKPAVFRPSFTASFIFPHRLNEHLAFCKEVPIYRCSCTHLPDGLHNIPGVQHVELEMDSLTVEAMVFSPLFPGKSQEITRNCLGLYQKLGPTFFRNP